MTSEWFFWDMVHKICNDMMLSICMLILLLREHPRAVERTGKGKK